MANFFNPLVGTITVDGPVADHYRLPEQSTQGWEEVESAPAPPNPPQEEQDPPTDSDPAPADPPTDSDPAPADPAEAPGKGKKGVSLNG